MIPLLLSYPVEDCKGGGSSGDEQTPIASGSKLSKVVCTTGSNSQSSVARMQIYESSDTEEDELLAFDPF